jgi:hypothetical protein
MTESNQVMQICVVIFMAINSFMWIGTLIALYVCNFFLYHLIASFSAIFSYVLCE